MDVIVIFDISDFDRLEEVKTKLTEKGYFFSWKNTTTNKSFDLPHNAAWKQEGELNTSKIDIENIVNGLNTDTKPLQLTKCIVLRVTPYAGKERSS